MAARNQPSALLKDHIEGGLDTLWKFQLRKENAALLEKLEENARAIELCRSENMRHFQDFNERIASIEATIANIEKTEDKVSKAWDSPSCRSEPSIPSDLCYPSYPISPSASSATEPRIFAAFLASFTAYRFSLLLYCYLRRNSESWPESWRYFICSKLRSTPCWIAYPCLRPIR